MRILCLAPHSYYRDRGTPIDVDILVRALSARGDTVDLVVYRDGEHRSYPGVTVHRPATPRWLDGIAPGFSFRKVLADLWLFATARRLLARGHYDLIHAGEEAVFLAMWFRVSMGIPYVYDMDSSLAQQLVDERPWTRPFRRFFEWCERGAIRGAVAVAPVCNALAELAGQRGARHVTTLHDISLMQSDAFAANPAVRQELALRAMTLMYVGNLEPYQGIDLLLAAFQRVVARHVEMDLVIAGGTEGQIRHYEKMAARLGIAQRTRFIGPWPVARLGELLGQADILTAPRIRGINTPMKVFPYVHSGRAVLVTRLPTHTQVLDDAVCELAPTDPDGFADAIVRLAQDEERRRTLGENGRRFVERNHQFPAHQRRVNQLYERIQQDLRPAPSPMPPGGPVSAL